MTTVPTPHGAPESVLMPWPATHYSCRVVEVSEDGDMFAVAGPSRAEHVDDRRALAAVLHYLRVDCIWSPGDFRDGPFEHRKIERKWVTVVDDDDEPWQWADAETPGAFAITYVETY